METKFEVDRWNQAEEKFLEYFYGKKPLAVVKKSKTPKKVEKVHRISSPKHKKEEYSHSKINRPQTAELTATQRKNLESFRELDKLVFTNEILKNEGLSYCVEENSFRPWSAVDSSAWLKVGTKITPFNDRKYEAINFLIPNKPRPLSDLANNLLISIINEFLLLNHDIDIKTQDVIALNRNYLSYHVSHSHTSEVEDNKKIGTTANEVILKGKNLFGSAGAEVKIFQQEVMELKKKLKLLFKDDVIEEDTINQKHLLKKQLNLKYALPKIPSRLTILTPREPSKKKSNLKDNNQSQLKECDDLKHSESSAFTPVFSAAAESLSKPASPATFRIDGVFPIEYFLDRCEVIKNFRKDIGSGVIYLASHNHLEIGLDDEQWKECVLLDYCCSTEHFLVEWKDAIVLTKKSWISQFDIKPKNEVKNTNFHKLNSFEYAHAQNLRQDFERKITINQFIGLLTPILKNCLSIFSTNLFFDGKKLDLASLTKIGKACDGIKKFEKLYENLFEEIKTDYYKCMTKQIITNCSQAFRSFLSIAPEFNINNYINELGYSISKINYMAVMEESKIEVGNTKKLASLLNSSISFFQNSKVAEVVLELRENLNLCLNKQNILEQFWNFELQWESSMENSEKKNNFSSKLFVAALSSIVDAFHRSTSTETVNLVHSSCHTISQIYNCGSLDQKECWENLRELQPYSKSFIEIAHNFISVIAKAQLIPQILNSFFEIIRMFRANEILINVGLELEISSADNGINMNYTESITNLSLSVKKLLIHWIAPVVPVFCQLPTGAFSTTPVEQRTILSTFNEIVDESVELCDHILNELRGDLIPTMFKVVELVKTTKNLDVSQSITKWKECQECLHNLSVYAKVRLSRPIKNGLFFINSENLREKVGKWIIDKQKLLFDSIQAILHSESTELIEINEKFLSLPVATTFEQTKKAAIQLDEMKSKLESVRLKHIGILKIKEFLDSQKHGLEDTDFKNYYRCFVAFDEINGFLGERYRDVSENMMKLRLTISREIQTFLELWKSVNIVLERLFTVPERLFSHEKSNFLKKKISIQKHQPDLQVLLKNIKNAIQVAAILQKKVYCINEFENDVPQSENLNELYNKMLSREKVIEGLLYLQQNLKTWTAQTLFDADPTLISQFTADFLSVVDNSDVSNSIIIKNAKEEVARFLGLEYCFIKILSYKQFKQWHWEQINEILNMAVDVKVHTVSDIINGLKNPQASLQLLNDVEESARRGSYLEETLVAINNRVMSLKCELVPYGGNSDLTIFSSFTTLLDILQGDLLTLRILDRSAEYYQTVINTLEHKLSQAQNAIKEWEILQPLMIKCFCFFDSDDVKFQLYGQAKRFAALERAYKLMITKIEGSKSLGSLVEENSELTSAVTNIKDGLIKLVNDIQFWLDNLRVSFPRLYFLSDDELLTLLSVGKNPSTIEKHLKKCFDFSGFVYNKRNANECYKIHSLKGKEGEVLKLRNIISTNVGIELWLSKIEQEMKNTMKEMLWSVFHDIHDSYEFNPITFYQHYGKKTLGQICFLSARILHTKEMETYVKLGQYQTMKRLGERSRETIAALIKLGPALFSTPNTFKSIVSLEMYYRDWNNELFVSKVKNKNAHSWIKGIKYYFDQEDMILTVNQSMGSMHYGFEYFGGTKDYIWNDNMINCFLTVWSSLDLKLGVFAHGDYASGKKSTLKEFANAVGHFAVLITCNEKSSIADLNRILTGVITSNSFCIFDKLHNQNSNVLSHLVKTIIFVREASQRQDLNSISFFGRTIKIPTFFGFLATIQSSALNNYETYSVVQSQLRSVSLIKPAFGVIAQGLLCINCFKESQILGMKLEEFFLLAKDYLSFQEHYDYSIRTLIAVIQCITQMKPKAFDSESHLIAEALMKYFLPKTILEDVDILKSLIQKTFPMVPLKSDIGLRTCSTYLQDDEATILLNAIQCGNPCLVLGSASCGKSTLIKKISKDLGKKLFCVNPEVENLLAFVQANSFIYEPSEPTMSENWLIIEAPDVKQSWADDAITMIESSRNNTIIIETDNLSGAYAYFVSRFQIVYLKSKWKWQVGLDLWLKSISVKKILTLDEKKLLKICFNRYMDQVFILVHNMGTVENSVVFQGLLRLLQALLLEKLQFRNNRIKMEDIFIFALIWAIGPTYSLKNQNKFVTILKEIFENSEIGDNLKFLKENNQSLFDLFLDLKTGKWRYWLDSESIPFNSNMKYTRSKYKYIADLLLRSQYNVLLMGEIGVRKTTTGMELLSNFSKNSLLFFESITKYSNSIERLTSYFQTVLAFDEDTAKYCATNGRKLIMFIDDLQNQENHQSMNLKILEYLRFIIGCKGFYNKSKIFKQMTNVSIITAIDCKSGNVKSLSNRLLRHFNVMYLPEEDFITGELTDYFIKQINENDANTDDIKNVTSQILSALNASIQVYAQFATKGISRIKSPLVFFSTFDIEKSFSPLLVYTKNPKDIVNINVPDLWVHESNKTYKSRLDSTDLLVYQDILQKVYFLNFHQPLKYENNIYSAIVLCNRAVNEKTFIRGFYQPIGKNFIENIKFLTEKLSTDKLRNMQLMPNSTEILCHIDSTLENKKYLEIILSEIGTEVVMDYIKIVKYFRDFDLKIFQVEINESENIWKNFFKNIVRKASLSDKTTIICVRFTIGCACKEIWEDIHCFINSGKTYQLWNNNEYDDLVQKFHTSEQRKIGKIAHCNITENEILLASVRLCDHLQDKLRFVICIDRSDSLSINCLTENYRALALGKLLLVKKLSALEYAILGKNEYISKKHLNEASISEISRIAGKTFLESQTSWKKSNSVDIFTLELFEKLIEIFNSNIAERSVFLQKHSDSLTFAQEKLQNKIEKLKGTIDSARMGLEEFPVTIKNISRELEFQKSKLMQCQELFQQASKSLREKEDQVGKILSQEQRDLKHRSLDEEKQKFIIAVRALHAVTKNDIEDFKSFVSPPSAIMQLCEALCILFDRIPGWAEAKSLLSSNTIIQKMSSLEFKTVSDLKFERIKRYEELLFPRIQGFQSAWVAARTFGIWFCALVRYMNEIKISESLSKSSKKNELKLSKVLNEKLEQERLSNELKTCERKYNSLLLFKQKNLGKYTLIKEMFAAHSVFDDKSIGREKQLSESQWIQQVFHCDNDLPVFSDKTVALKHELYQRELLNVAKIKNEFDNPSGVAMKYMEDISNKLEKISYAYLQELFSIHSPTNFEIRAKEIILRFLDLRSDTSVKALYESLHSCDPKSIALENSFFIKSLSNDKLFEKVAFYDQSKSNLTPLSPVQSCIGSIYIRDFMKSLYSFVSGCEHLANELKAAQANLTETKKSFDECWMNIYSENLEIWTMEDIITKFQEIRKRILNTKNMESHTAVHSSHPLLHKLLLVACSTTDYKESEAENFHTFISKNPNKFLKTLSEYRANDEKLNDAINLHIRPMCEISNLIPAVEEKVSRMFVDIITLFPSSINFRIFRYLDHKAIGRSSCVSKAWQEVASTKIIWKHLCYRRGWGFAFTINKNPDWKLYFKTMLLKIEERTPTLLKQFRDEMKKVFGLESYKRVSTFLTGIVEFVKLEKISKSKELNDTIDFEFANHCFITIEEAMTAMLIGEAISTGHRIISAKEAIERKSSLRNRIVYIQCQCSNGVSFEAKPVHSLILKVAHKYEMLVPQLEKIRRQMANGSTQTPIVRFEFPQADNNLMLARENTTKTNESIYILLAEYFKIIYSFHRGVEMGKFLQFQDRFFKSMIFLNEKLKNLLDGNHAELKLLPSTEFFKAAYLTFAGHFPKETRDNLLRNWKQDLNMKSKEFCELAQIAKEDSYLFNSDFMQQNKLLVKNSKKIILFLDPNSIAEKFLANIYPDEKEFEILNAIDVLSSKNLFSSNCRTALLKFYEFEVKTPIINLVAGILKSKKNIFLSTFTNKSDIFENCLSKNLGIGLEVIDISLNSELTFMLILDIIMETFKPSFILRRNSKRAEFRQLELEVKNSLHSIVEKAVNALDILEDVDCMLEVIHLKRKFIELEEKGQQLKLIENESNLLLEPYRSFAKFCNDLYWIVQNSSKIDKFYIFKDNMFEGILHSCIKHNTNDETTELNSVLADKIAMMMIENLTKISRAFPEIDQGPFLCSLLISKAEYLCEISSNMVEFFKKIISKLSSGGLDKNFTIFMWISDEFMPQALTNKVFKPSLVDAFELIAKQKENWQSQLQQLINLKSDPFTTSLIYLLYSPTCFLSMINLNFPNLSGIISKNLPVFKDQSYESKNMLVITYSIRGAIHKVNHTFAKLDQSHNQLLIFNDEDKLDNAWFDKLTFAINNGNWVLICLDEYWTSNLPQILQNTVLAATGFHLWLIATIHQKDNLPNWLPKFCDVVFEETPKNASIVSQDLMFKILDEETKPTKMYDVRIFMLIKFHAMIVFYQDRLLPYTPFSDMDLKFAIKKFNQSINCGIPRILQRELVLEEVYIPKLKSKASISFMLEVWKLSVELFDKSFPVIYEVPITGLEEVFWKVEPELFRQEVKKTLNLTQPKHVRIVSYIAKKFQNLFGLAKSSSTQIVNFTVLENFINTIPNDNHLRLLMETKINDNYNLFLREEVINLRQFTKASRDVLIKLYNSNKFLKSGNILDWVTSKLPMYPHIQKMNMEDWIILLEHISTHLLNWITLGKPKHINTNLIISLPKFFKEILGFKLDNFMEMNVLSKENLPHCSNNNFIIHGLLLEGGSIENKGVMTCHGFSENLPPVQFRSKVDFPAEKYKKTTIPLHCGKEDLLARVKQYDNQTVGGILINSNNTGLMQKGNLSVVARNAEELANISNSNYNVSKLNWPNAFISTKGAKLQKQITICICSTDDCENERHLFFEKIFPALAKYFEENSVKLHFVDIKWENFPSHCSKEETLLSSLQQMDRSDILVILAGSKTGSKFNSSQLAAYSQLSNGSFNLPLSNLYDFEIQVNYGLKKFPDNHLVYARDPRYAASVPKSFKSQYEADDFCSGQAMEDLKKVLLEKKNFKEYNCHFSHIENKGVKMGGLEHLKNWAINDLTSAINAHLEKNAENTKKMLLIPSLEMYVEKTIQYCKNVEDGFSTIIYGISGIGKCTVLQKISENLKKEDYIVLEAAIGQEEIIIEQLIYSFILKLGEDLKSCNVSFLKGRMEVEKMFLDLLSSAKQQSKKVAVIMHSVEKVKNNLDSILWLSRLLEFNKKMENGAFWLFSTADLDIANNFKINHQNIVIQEINSVQLEDFEFLATNLNNPKIGKSIADSNYCKTIFHANLIVWELQKMRYAGVLVKAEKLPKTHMDILIKNLEQLEESKNGQIITKLFSGLATSRSGLYEDEILEIFQLHFSNWNLIYNEVQYFLKINKDGKITLYHSIFHKLICKRYLKLEEKIFWNEKLAEFFQQKFKKPTRIVDSAYHLLKSQCTASKFVKIIASIKFIEASYFIGLGNDIPLVFSKALKIAKAQEDYSSVKRIKEFIYFFQTNHSVLRETPSLTFTLALNLPIGFCDSVRLEAESLKKESKCYLLNLSQTGSNINFVTLGRHRSLIIQITIQITKSFGKCCLSISDDGTIESWDLNSYLPICTVLDKPFPPKSIKDCCFTLNGAERAIMACNNGDICVFDLMPPKMIFLAPSKNNYGALLLASSNLNGVWVQNERRLDWVKFENTSLMLNQPKVLTSKPLNQSLFIEVCDKVLVRSLDQQKAVIFSSKSEEIIVINLMKMKEISRFKDKFIDSAAKGKFSNSKDLLALSRKDQAIMVWKLDTHSRHSLMKSQPDLGEIKSICFSGDEKFIFCGYHDSKRGYITMGNVILGNWLRIIAVSNDCPIYHLSICTILGEERFFSVWKDNIYCCDPRSVISVVKSNALVEEKTRHSGMVKQIYLTSDSGLISASSENEIYVWQNNPEKGKILIFQHQYKFSTKINYLQLFTQLKLCFIATENFVYIYKYSQTYKAEILKVEHSSEVKSVTINCYNENKYEIQMVTITTDDVLRCWTMEYSDPMKKAKILFEKESVQFLPQNPFISDGKKLWIVQNYHNLVLINSRTGEELEIFTTWGQENINEVSISNDATDDNELNPVQNIAISTENTIYFNFEVWSSGGRYEDKYRITGCNYDPISNNIGYSAFESSKNISDLDVNQSFQDKSKIESRGILVILSVSLKKRIFTFIQSSRILFWEFLKSKSNKSDKNTEETISNKIVTIGEDTVLRIFDIENLLDENLFKKQLEVEAPVLAQYPLNCKTSYLTVANSAPLIYIGNENGQVIILKFCVNSLIIESEEM